MRLHFSLWWAFPPISIEDTLNFKHRSVRCLDYITGVPPQREWSCISSFFSEHVIFSVISHNGCRSSAPPPFSPSAKTTDRPLTGRLLQDKPSPDTQAWQLTPKSLLLIQRNVCVYMLKFFIFLIFFSADLAFTFVKRVYSLLNAIEKKLPWPLWGNGAGWHSLLTQDL